MGVSVLGRAIAEIADPRMTEFGDFKELTPEHELMNRAFIMPDGKILAFYKTSSGGDIQTLGIKGGNNYNDYWHSRTIYSEDCSTKTSNNLELDIPHRAQ